MNDINVGIFADYINPYKGGHSRNIYYLVKNLEQQGCNVTVFCLKSEWNSNIDINIITFPLKRPSFFSSSKLVAKYAKENEQYFDIFHSNIGFGYPYLYYKEKKPFILHLRSSYYDHFMNNIKTLKYWSFNIEFYKNIISSFSLFLNEKHNSKLSHYILCNSEELKNNIITQYGIPEYKIGCLYNGVNLNKKFRHTNKMVLEEKKYENKIKLLFVSRFGPLKRIERLLYVFKKIVKKNDDVILTLLGDGILFNDIYKFIQNNNLEKKILMPGYIMSDIIQSYYIKSNLFISPCPLGTTALESINAGLPIIAYSKDGDIPPGVPENLMRKYDVGKLIKNKTLLDFYHSIQKTIYDETWLNRQKKIMSYYIKKYHNWNSIAKKCISIYKKLIEDSY